ncbi:response regulator transcription factor [Candidatus Dependentiae bacterium]|nr:response regulator transcription factor [Candidatus Dependentiae bacterium]
MALFLLADDEKQVEQLIRFKLSKEGHFLDYVQNGEEALQKIGDISKTYDVIILDIMMPVFDGIYALKKIREIDKYKKTPIIMLSAKSNENDVIKGYDSGATEYITKPFSPSEFYARIKKYL